MTSFFLKLLSHPTVIYVVRFIFYRSVWARMMRIGSVMLVASAMSGYVLDIKFPWSEGVVDFHFDSAGGTPALITWIIFGAGFATFITGFLGSLFKQRREEKEDEKKRVFVVESRGLRDVSDVSLKDAVSLDIVGKRHEILIDIRENIHDGKVSHPDVALEKVCSGYDELIRHLRTTARDERKIIYGGLTPVPMTFLLGALVDDEHDIELMDWDRIEQRWRCIDQPDMGARFKAADVASLNYDESEVGVAVSVSYEVNVAEIQEQFGNIPIIELRLPELSSDAHWSDDVQKELVRSFRNLLGALENKRVRLVRLFIAAPNSLVFRFGRAYDRRNHPDAIIYQREKGEAMPRPWGVRLPSSNQRPPEIVLC